MVKSIRKKIPPGIFLLAIVCILNIDASAGNNLQNSSLTDSAQSIIQPVILDNDEQPIQGAGISNTRTLEVAITDAGGHAKLSADKGDILRVSIQGSIITEFTVDGNTSPVIIVSSKHPAVLQSKEVRLLNKTSMPSNLTAASTQAVYNSDITKMPVTSVRNALIGRLAGIYTNQASGLPGDDGVSLSLRGRSPLVLIDGIPRNLTIFDLEEIESITVLKDALSTAMLGVRASNGALLITTRKGSPTRQRISFTVQSGMQEALKMPKALNSYNYASLYNEALANDGLAPAYTDADLQGYLDGSDPYRYPDVDWRKQVLKSSARMDRYTMSASGGNEFARYFVSLEHLNQTGLLQQSDSNTYSTNNYFKSYTIRSNVDINVTPTVTTGIHLLGRVLNSNEPGFGVNNIFASFLLTPNNAYPIFNTNGTYGAHQRYPYNIWAQTIGSGYQQNYKRDMLADFYIKRTLNEITDGLWIRATGSYYATISENILRAKTSAVFQPVPPGPETYQQYSVNSPQANGNGIEYQGRSDYMELAIGYDKQFGVHGIHGIVLQNRDNAVNGSDLPYTITGTSGRLSYNYNAKYVAEVAFGLNGSNRYPPKGNTKYGFFPAVGLAWNISEENFLKETNWLNTLKLFGSYGKTGLDNPGYFTYIQRYFDGAGAVFGTGAGGNTSINEQPIANPNATWEKANKTNVGLQATVLDNKLSATVEYYTMKFYDLLMERGKNTSLLGNTYPTENIGSNRYMGWDFQLTWQQSLKQVNYFISANAGVQNSKVLFMDEVFRPYEWMERTGRRVGQAFGYVSEGLFQDQTEIDNSATLDGYTPQPGDIKYRDLNDDGVINQFDQAPIATKKPLFTYGVNMGISWKYFDVSVLVQGVANRNIYLGGNVERAFFSNGQAYEHHLNRWTPENGATATYPRLSAGTNINNEAFSSYWMKSGDYLRVKFIELGFTVPTKFTNSIRMQSARIFVNGTNLFTQSSIDRIDPEVSGIYPMQRVINVGVNVKL